MQQEQAMKSKVSLPGLLFGALTALAAGLLVSHYSLAWLIIGLAVGMLMGVVLARPDRTQDATSPLKLHPTERKTKSALVGGPGS
jgi:hypothetical protein